MKREIKFKGERIDNNEEVYGYYYKGVIEETPLSVGDCKINHIIIANGTFYHVKPETVKQYIGMKDRNGDEIYEDQTIKLLCCDKCKEEEITAVVKRYWDGWWYFTDKETKGRMGELISCYSTTFNEKHKTLSKCEIVT